MPNSYPIIFAPTAAKQFKKLDSSIQFRIEHALTKLSTSPFLGKILKGELRDYRSYRVGDYRIIYFLRKSFIQIEIIRIAHRREVYL